MPETLQVDKYVVDIIYCEIEKISDIIEYDLLLPIMGFPYLIAMNDLPFATPPAFLRSLHDELCDR